MMDFSSGFSVNTSTKQKQHKGQSQPRHLRCFFPHQAHKHSASISHSPSGSNSLVTPSFCSATLKAFCRLWVGLDLFSLLYSTRSGLKERKTPEDESNKTKEKKSCRGTLSRLVSCVFMFQWEWIWPFVSPYRCLCMRALKAMPSFQLVVKFVMLTLWYLQSNSQWASVTEHRGLSRDGPVSNRPMLCFSTYEQIISEVQRHQHDHLIICSTKKGFQ